MNEKNKLRFIDYLVFLVKYKRLILITVFLTGIIGYLTIYFFIDEQFDSKSVIIPAKDEGLGGIGGLLGDLGNLPLGLGDEFSNEEMGMYNTIIYSRTLLEKVIYEFKLIDIYELDKDDPEHMEKAIKILSNNISTIETPNFAYEIEVRSPDPDLSATMNNFIVKEMNNKIVEMKIEKSKNNRIFLEERVAEIKDALSSAEDSLRFYQEKSGMLEAVEQVKEVMGIYGELETELIKKQIEVSILKQIYPSGHPQLEEAELGIKEYSKKIQKLKLEGEDNSLLLSLKSIPEKAVNYFRNFRNVEINSAILQFVLPLYEQAKFEEQKDVPVIQIVDVAVPPAKKSFPPRTIFTLILMFIAFLICFVFILLNENENWQSSDKYKYIRTNLFKWK